LETENPPFFRDCFRICSKHYPAAMLCNDGSSFYLLFKIYAIKMKRIFFLFLIYFLIQIPAYSKALAISGHVTDARTKEPLAGASVSIPDLRVYTIADKNGTFYFNNIPEKGKFLIEIKFIGYKTLTR